MDPLLLPWLNAGNEAQATDELACLLMQHATPVARRTVRARLPEAEWHDLESQVRIELMQRLAAWRSGRSEAIEDFAGYVAVLSCRVCYSWLREKRPEYMRLRNRIRYIVEHDPALSRQVSADAGPMPGTVDFNSFAPLPLREMISAILKSVTPARVTLRDLATAVARLRNVSETASDELAEPAVPHPEAGLVASMDRRRALAELWLEVRQLPLRQRFAVLLSLKAIEALPVCGIATISDIAAVLEMPVEEFAAVWNCLPLDDLSIARRLESTRQQVINLRKSARERLLRRVAVKWGGLVISASIAILHIQEVMR
ncbi:MAG: hypothetical protein SGI92_02335 [Bryobacteraceae bacterium]|nr:hypothetical protein [Bryobacteraceae bacterium]